MTVKTNLKELKKKCFAKGSIKNANEKTKTDRGHEFKKAVLLKYCFYNVLVPFAPIIPPLSFLNR